MGTKEQIIMERDDWEKLYRFVNASNAMLRSICKAEESGKRQLSIEDKAIQALKDADPDKDFWVRYGALIGSNLMDNEVSG